jgi:hypothetical protein
MPTCLCLYSVYHADTPFVVKIVRDLGETGGAHNYEVMLMGTLSHTAVPSTIRASFYQVGNQFYTTLTKVDDSYTIGYIQRTRVNQIRYLYMSLTQTENMRLPFYAEIVPLERPDEGLNVRFLGLAPAPHVRPEDLERVKQLMMKRVFQYCYDKKCDAGLFYNGNGTWRLKGYAGESFGVEFTVQHDAPIVVAGGARRGRTTLEKLTVKELRERCARRGVAYRGKRKAELVAALRRKRRAT